MISSKRTAIAISFILLRKRVLSVIKKF